MLPPLSQSDEPTTTSTAQQVVSDQNAPKEDNPKAAKLKKVHDEFRQRVDACKVYRRKLVANWTVSIDYRRGKPFSSQTDEDQVSVNLDWPLTKSKQAALFSQVPQVRLDHAPDTLPAQAPWAPKFERKLNDFLIQAGIEAAMDECLPDCINAAGIAAILVSFESITVNKDIPVQTPTDGEEPEETTSIPTPVDQRYVTQRISPADLLWPVTFTGASYDNAPWIGRSGRITWAEAVQRFDLKESDKESILGEDRSTLDKLTHDVDRDKPQADQMVGFDEIFYKEFQFDPEAQSYSTIHHLVFVAGKDDPVVDEPWKGQKKDDQSNAILGAQKFPIRVLTLTYITDESVPPSDSAIGRPQVNEINKSRTQLILQRQRSLPIRTMDVNRLDPAIQQSLMRGVWQGIIPVQGDGSRIITEISRAQTQPESYKFDQMIKGDLNRQWVIPVDPDSAEEMAKGDPNQNHSNFNTQIGRERAKVASFFLGVAEVLGGLMCLYEDPATFGDGFSPALSKALKFSILADSTVLLDAGQKLARLNQFVNTYAKSGWINVEPVLQEIATLTGLDPSVVIKAPSPKPPVEPNISLRLTGVEDMLNPLALAFLIKSGQAPPPEMIEQAKSLIQQAVVPPQTPPGPDGQPPQGGGAPMPPGLPPGAGGPPAPPVQGPPPGSPTPPPQPPKLGEAHPNWSVMPALNKRSEGNQK